MSLFAGTQFRYLQDQASAKNEALVGSKAVSLIELGCQQFPLPDWFVVTTEAFTDSVDWSADSISDLDSLNKIKPSLFYLEVNAKVKIELEQALSQFDSRTLFALRSSAIDEKNGDISVSQLLETFLCVRAEDVATKISDVWRSAFNERAFTNRKRYSKNKGISPPAVIVQTMVDADKSGVAFSIDPLTGAHLSVVSSVFGLGESLVSEPGGVDNYRVGDAGYVISQAGKKAFFCRQGFGGLEIIEFDKPETRLSLNEEEARQVAALVQKVANYFACPQEIEWAIRGDKLFLLQARAMERVARQQAANIAPILDTDCAKASSKQTPALEGAPAAEISTAQTPFLETPINETVKPITETEKQAASQPEDAFWKEISIEPLGADGQKFVIDSKELFWQGTSSEPSVIDRRTIPAKSKGNFWQEISLEQEKVENQKNAVDANEIVWQEESSDREAGEEQKRAVSINEVLRRESSAKPASAERQKELAEESELVQQEMSLESRVLEEPKSPEGPEEPFWRKLDFKPKTLERADNIVAPKLPESTVENMPGKNEIPWQKVTLEHQFMEPLTTDVKDTEPLWRKLAFSSPISKQSEIVPKSKIVEEEVKVIEPVAVVEEEVKVIEPVAVVEEEVKAIEPVAVVEEEVKAIELEGLFEKNAHSEPQAAGLEVLKEVLSNETPNLKAAFEEAIILRAKKGSKRKVYIWDNAGVDEGYSGITTPLSFSFVRKAYKHASIQFCRLMHVSESTINANQSIFSNMLGFIHGRIYYNLLNLSRLVDLFPFFKRNGMFLEYVMGVSEPLPEDLVSPKNSEKAPALTKLAIIVLTAGWRFLLLPKCVRQFNERYRKTLLDTDKDLSKLTLEQLAARYRALENISLYDWDAPLINDFFAMLFISGLRSLTSRWCNDEDGTLQSNLIAEETDMLSAEQRILMTQAANIASQNFELNEVLLNDDIFAIKKMIQKYSDFERITNEYLVKFGDSFISELKFESLRVSEDLLSFYRAIGHLVTGRDFNQNELNSRNDISKIRKDAEISAQKSLENDFFKTCLFIWVLDNTRALLKQRQNLKIERARLFARLRELILAIALILRNEGVLNEARDVFYLEVNELLDYIEGTATSFNLNDLISLRKREIDNYKSLPAPPNRIEADKPVYLSGELVAGISSKNNANEGS